MGFQANLDHTNFNRDIPMGFLTIIGHTNSILSHTNRRFPLGFLAILKHTNSISGHTNFNGYVENENNKQL